MCERESEATLTFSTSIFFFSFFSLFSSVSRESRIRLFLNRECDFRNCHFNYLLAFPKGFDSVFVSFIPTCASFLMFSVCPVISTAVDNSELIHFSHSKIF